LHVQTKNIRLGYGRFYGLKNWKMMALEAGKKEWREGKRISRGYEKEILCRRSSLYLLFLDKEKYSSIRDV